MPKTPIMNRPYIIPDIRILLRALSRLPLDDQRGNDGEGREVFSADEIRDRHVETFVEMEGGVVEEFSGAAGGDGVGVGALC
jgi:hypothetical protein